MSTLWVIWHRWSKSWNLEHFAEWNGVQGEFPSHTSRTLAGAIRCRCWESALKSDHGGSTFLGVRLTPWTMWTLWVTGLFGRTSLHQVQRFQGQSRIFHNLSKRIQWSNYFAMGLLTKIQNSCKKLRWFGVYFEMMPGSNMCNYHQPPTGIHVN